MFKNSFVFFTYKQVKATEFQYKKKASKIKKYCFNRSHNINKKAKSYLFFTKPARFALVIPLMSSILSVKVFCNFFLKRFLFFYKTSECFFRIKIITKCPCSLTVRT